MAAWELEIVSAVVPFVFSLIGLAPSWLISRPPVNAEPEFICVIAPPAVELDKKSKFPKEEARINLALAPLPVS